MSEEKENKEIVIPGGFIAGGTSGGAPIDENIVLRPTAEFADIVCDEKHAYVRLVGPFVVNVNIIEPVVVSVEYPLETDFMWWVQKKSGLFVERNGTDKKTLVVSEDDASIHCNAEVEVIFSFVLSGQPLKRERGGRREHRHPYDGRSVDDYGNTIIRNGDGTVTIRGRNVGKKRDPSERPKNLEPGSYKIRRLDGSIVWGKFKKIDNIPLSTPAAEKMGLVTESMKFGGRPEGEVLGEIAKKYMETTPWQEFDVFAFLGKDRKKLGSGPNGDVYDEDVIVDTAEVFAKIKELDAQVNEQGKKDKEAILAKMRAARPKEYVGTGSATSQY